MSEIMAEANHQDFAMEQDPENIMLKEDEENEMDKEIQEHVDDDLETGDGVKAVAVELDKDADVELQEAEVVQVDDVQVHTAEVVQIFFRIFKWVWFSGLLRENQLRIMTYKNNFQSFTSQE